ncbi:MAG: oxidoreductase [Gammaproteobacteria bacterium]|nr:oxidoreductase [Gammaproteobacteria bacterium]
MPKSLPEDSGAGLIMLQIDGLSNSQLSKALESGAMPFLKRLLAQEHYQQYSLYSGVPSSTPAVQGELFYGVRGCVPAFKFKRPADSRPVTPLEPGVAAALEAELRKQGGRPLLEGGSSYSNIFTGGAAESSFCAASLGWSNVIPTSNALKMMIFTLAHIFSYIRVAGLMLVELVLAIVDFVRGMFSGRNLPRELAFVPIRVAVSVLLRELVSIGIRIDIDRGLPIVHANFIGYDEQAHRRGPGSRFAHWGLRGIDRAIARIWRAAQRSKVRDYDVWIYSDHGQQPTHSYPVEFDSSIRSAVMRVLSQNIDGPLEMVVPGEVDLTDRVYGNLESQNVYLLGSQGLSAWFRRFTSSPPNQRLVATELAAMGPLGFVYLDLQVKQQVRERVAKQLVDSAGIPMVMCQLDGADSERRAEVWTGEGKFYLPRDKHQILGSDHPFLDAVSDDLISLASHPYAGRWVLIGWQANGRDFSFRIENGAHGGPGPEETHAFAMLPMDAHVPRTKTSSFLRLQDLRSAALALRTPNNRAFSTAIKPVPLTQTPQSRSSALTSKRIRVMTYNIHACKGMDGTTSISRIARIIARVQPDIIALQELDVRPGSQQAAELASALQLSIHYFPAQHLASGRYGNAILTRYPLQLVRAERLVGRGKTARIGKSAFNQPRGALWVKLDVDGNQLNVITTHLGLTGRERCDQVTALLGEDWLANEQCQQPVILCGDFNCGPGQMGYRRLANTLGDAQRELTGVSTKNTFAGRYPTLRIDHVFVSSDLRVKNVQVPRTSLTRIASDHLPLVVDLQLAD